MVSREPESEHYRDTRPPSKSPCEVGNTVPSSAGLAATTAAGETARLSFVVDGEA